MRSVSNGVQWTSHVSPRTKLTAGLLAIAILIPIAASAPTPAEAATNYILMSRSALMARPVSGTPWRNLKSVAGQSLGTPNMCDQNSRHHLRTLAAALVFARTGIASYGAKARGGVKAAITTQRSGCNNATLALGRQLMAYVLAADFAGLTGTPDATFRSWLRTIRTKIIGGHSKWDSLSHTHTRSANNWGAYAGASRIAASLYLGDTADVASAARITQGFLGNRTAHKFWSILAPRRSPGPARRPITRRSMAGAAAAASWSTARWSWTSAAVGIGSGRPATTASTTSSSRSRASGMQVELLFKNGYTSAWKWSNRALKRMAMFVNRSRASGGTGWNETQASRQMPWLLDRRLGMTIPRRYSGMGRSIGFTDWLWG